ncbi:unnamed protein product [Pleuronectes platessa]|uniref:Uncharacterized protein n=1 Tax=Pleuronectes platessa TaxID=8262 RepID=A0A9N7YGK8_PLEPL|nr:unnamed protein product [Pleuronectes platessa]
MSAVGEEIRQAVLLVLPSLQEDKLQSLLNNLERIRVESRGDLQFIKEEDLPADITRIQCRRLLNAWQTEDETTCVTLTTVDPSDIYFSTTTENPSSSQSTSSHSKLYSHFKLLTDIDILDKMKQAMEEQGKLILPFFEQKPAGTNADEVDFPLDCQTLWIDALQNLHGGWLDLRSGFMRDGIEMTKGQYIPPSARV